MTSPSARVVVLFWLGLLLVPAASRADSSSFTSADIVEASSAVDCVDWRIRGVCLKLKCGFFGCRIRARPWIEHRIPDLVVSAYNEPGDIPWAEAGGLFGTPLAEAVNTALQTTAGVSIGGGHATSSRPGQSGEGRIASGNLRFKEVSVIGNPAVAAYSEWLAGEFDLTCPTSVDPLMPYFSSELDALSWRTGLAEMIYPEAWLPHRRTIGDFPFKLWGTVYPRTGNVHQNSDVKAGAVAAQRAVDVVTRSSQPHVYRQVPGIPESNENTDHWQMIHPASDSRCTAFGTDPDYSDGRENPDPGSYGWIYWPLHHCCPGSGRTIARIPFN